MLWLSLTHDIVGASYPAKVDPPTYFLRFVDQQEMHYDEQGCIELGGFGLGFTVQSRESVEAVASRCSLVYDEMSQSLMRDVFRIDTTDSMTLGSPEIKGCPEEWYGKPLPALRGEDMAYFDDCREAGFKVWLYPDMDLGHCGSKVYRGDLMEVLGLRKLTKGEGHAAID
jgi:hypothetical protein